MNLNFHKKIMSSYVQFQMHEMDAWMGQDDSNMRYENETFNLVNEYMKWDLQTWNSTNLRGKSSVVPDYSNCNFVTFVTSLFLNFPQSILFKPSLSAISFFMTFYSSPSFLK